MKIGYTMMCEQRGPKDLVDDLVLAEQAGFDFSVISDHYSPWLEEQGHSPYAWSVLGAAAAKTERIGLMTYVTCPTFRYHPAIVAQKAATVALLADGRFRLGLGAGENLNEHIVGGGWPAVDVRHERLREAVEIIRACGAVATSTTAASTSRSSRRSCTTCRTSRSSSGSRCPGQQSCELAGELADIAIAVEPDGDLVRMFADAGGRGKPVVGQAPLLLRHRRRQPR